MRSGLLDSEPEQVFDALTRMAATLLKVPASFVAVVDSDRDFYKSQTGFPDALAVSRQLQGTTFCHHTLARNGPLVIADTHARQPDLAGRAQRGLAGRALVCRHPAAAGR